MRIRLLLILLVATLVQPLFAAAPDKQAVASYTEKLLADNFAKDGPGAAVLVTRGDDVLYRGARGMASLELSVPLSANQVFRLGSLTKQFASAAVLHLIDAGKLTLDDPLSKFVPGYPNGEKITVRMLLNHTSGVRDYTDIPGRMNWEIQKDMTTAQLIDSFKNEKPDFAPGTQWSYDNSGYVLVGAVIESVTGMSWHAYLDQLFFKPLHLVHTGYGDETVAVIPGHVMGYTRNGDHWAVAHYLSMTQPHAAGSLVSNVDDLLRWNLALHGGKLLSKQRYAQMTTPSGAAVAAHYGFGIMHTTLRGQTILEHSGGIFGFNTALLYLPDSRISVAVLANFDEGTPKMSAATTLAHLLAAYAMGMPYPEKRAIPMDAVTLKAYAGVYRIDKHAVRVLRIVDGRLTSQRTGGKQNAMLPIAKDEFLYDEGLSRVRFERDAAGRISAMRLFPDDEGEGERASRTNEPLPKQRVAVDLPKASIERVVGDYRNGEISLKLSLEGNKLFAQLGDQPKFEVLAQSATLFFLKNVDVTLEFPAGDKPPRSLTLHQAAQSLKFERVAKH
ncbi:MAG: serine hydrolase [Rudaea sp.]